tara:strand:- start:7821 stop:8519 length:699 start_codon:yes stop_codon:yes gene_type:complete
MEVTKKDVEKLIELRKENTFLNHLWNVFSRDMRAKGQINQNNTKVWNQNIWNMTFYPIFTFEFNSKNHLTNIRTELNPVGKTLIGIILIGLIWLIFPKDLSEFDLADNWQMATFLAIFSFLIVWVAKKLYRFEKQNQLEQIFEILDVETEKKKPEKEWSLKNILIRLFTYPFSIFIVFLSIWFLFEYGIKSIIQSILGIGVCGMYLYADIKMIMKAKKTTGNNVYNTLPKFG